MEENYRRYPIGIQNFEELRNRQCVYVDKTELVYRLANTDKVYFSAVPVGLAKVYLYLRSKPIFKEKRTFQRPGNGTAGKGMDSLSGTTHRLQPDEIHRTD